MPTYRQHLAQADHNERFVSSFDVDSTQFNDWVVTGMFYAALHYVNAYLAYAGYPPSRYKSHGRREGCMARDRKLRHDTSLYDCYEDLHNDSESARYYMKKLPPADVRQLRDVQLRTVRDAILALLPSP